MHRVGSALRLGSGPHPGYTATIDQVSLRPRPTARDVLTDVFGYGEFRPGQEKIISTVLAGRDCIGVMPTGAGKSLTFQIPARLLSGTVVVVSPLISLMKDQVDGLERYGFRATVLNSSLDAETRRARMRGLRSGEYELVYVAPEGLEGGLRSFLADVRVSLVVVDEAHCISEWGHDFRPSYRRLRGLKHELGGVPILALTATATRRVAGDIIRQLGMEKPDGYKGSFFRPNLVLTAHRKGDGRGSRKDLLAYVRSRSGESGIIYSLTRRNVESLTEFLCGASVRAVPYHAGLDAALRTRHQEAFARDEADVVVATIAFGMGIDKSNVRYVIHREMPRSVESYYQEIGRAGRDGLASDCILLYSWADVMSHERLQESIVDADVRAAAGTIGVSSGFRPYDFQVDTYNRYVSMRGKAAADLRSARPGHSEHQTGLAVDVVACDSGCGDHDGFGGTPQSDWIAENAWRYGFIVRYEEGRTATTGYSAEPWHLRFIGRELAGAYADGGFHTLEEFFGLEPAPDYG